MVFKPLVDSGGRIPIVRKSIAGDTIRPILTDTEVLALARRAGESDTRSDRAFRMDWSRDGSGQLHLKAPCTQGLQALAETARLKRVTIRHRGPLILSGLGIGNSVSTGYVCRLTSARQFNRFPDQAILVTKATNPEWLAIMNRAAAVVTEQGTRTSHTAIACRELGIPAILGAGEAVNRLTEGQPVTIACTGSEEGFVYEGIAGLKATQISPETIPSTRTRLMLNLGNPGAALRWWRLPADGIGLARMEFIINNVIRIHPMALIHPERVTGHKTREQIERRTAGWTDKVRFFIESLARGIALIAASQHPKPVTIRTSDFKSNEHARLIGGKAFEPREANPMLGWRGASRYYSPGYREAFALECQAIRMARDEIGLDNIRVMIPFCRTPEEADRVLATLAANGLTRGERGLAVYMTAEVPANIELAEEFARRFDGFSIGTNDLTQLTLGVDRDSELLAYLFDERHEAVKRMIVRLIRKAHRCGREVGLCGQAPADHPDFAEFLVDCGIDFMSVSPDSFLSVREQIARAESEGLQT